ncbi:MAG: YqeG family HAD IIIA-type phosphatase [Clostridiales bacterium]|nr:YqeG family HAD IIIA-type phosphatase [Clostridiales bacterium]
MALLLPDYRVRRVTDIKPAFLRELGVGALLLDVDNTLSTHGGQTPLKGLAEWIRSMREQGILLLIVSNARKRRVEPFAGRLGLDFQALSLKPLPFGYLRAVRRLGLKRRQAAIVGDQLFTDALGGNLAGVTTILVEPILAEKGRSFVLRRKWEKRILSRHTIPGPRLAAGNKQAGASRPRAAQVQRRKEEKK